MVGGSFVISDVIEVDPPQAAKYSHYKHLSRQELAAAGVCVPAFRIINLSEEIAPQLDGFALPCVVKPLALSGSRGVIRAGSGYGRCHQIDQMAWCIFQFSLPRDLVGPMSDQRRRDAAFMCPVFVFAERSV